MTPKLVEWGQLHSGPGAAETAPAQAPQELAVEHPQDTSFREIPLTQGKVAIVDAADYEWLAQWRWHYDSANAGHYTGYAKRKGVGAADGVHRTVYIHNAIMQPPDGLEVDHVNGDGLDNRRVNLRLATKTQQLANRPPYKRRSSRFKGVAWSVERRRWRVVIYQGKARQHIGYFDDEEEAGRAYDAVARIRTGEFAWLNFPEDGHVQAPDRHAPPEEA